MAYSSTRLHSTVAKQAGQQQTIIAKMIMEKAKRDPVLYVPPKVTALDVASPNPLTSSLSIEARVCARRDAEAQKRTPIARSQRGSPRPHQPATTEYSWNGQCVTELGEEEDEGGGQQPGSNTRSGSPINHIAVPADFIDCRKQLDGETDFTSLQTSPQRRTILVIRAPAGKESTRSQLGTTIGRCRGKGEEIGRFGCWVGALKK
ncbi:hypothetical protein F4779DRAFT_623489 [Xylariaceae sp. FL0662B]|nr:hypothetical protein F4779DRAFT_623489 [Xylariaceae sp. FL0662B]